MKRWIMLFLLLVGMVVFVNGERLHVELADSVTFLGGDSTNENYTDTLYYEFPLDVSDFRFCKILYQSLPDTGELLYCSTWVSFQTGTGGLDGLWQTIGAEMIITDDSNFTTTGYNLINSMSTDSLLNFLRMRVIMYTDSTGEDSLTPHIADNYIQNHTVDVILKK